LTARKNLVGILKLSAQASLGPLVIMRLALLIVGEVLFLDVIVCYIHL